MKILVSTTESQGSKKGDFNWTESGEILTIGMECDNSCSCGCDRAMPGTKTHKATTTFKVVESPLTMTSYIRILRDSLIDAGWYKSGDSKAIAHAGEIAREIVRIANVFPAGTVLGKTRKAFVKRAKAEGKD